MKNFFKVLHHSKKTKSRLGEIKTSYGIIKTPAFVPVATKGTIKSLPLQFIKDIGIQVSFVNTYHLVCHPGTEIIEAAGGIHKYSGLNIPLMSDSGGFQVFSLASPTRPSKSEGQSGKSRYKIGTKAGLADHKKIADIRGEEKPLLVKISDDGVKFRSTFDGKLIEFTPEKSMEYQRQIGADINMAFDECIYYGSTYEYARNATERTHKWLERCISYNKSEIRSKKSETNFNISNFKNSKLNIFSDFEIRASDLNQYLYGVIQGGVFEDLRKESAEFVVTQNTPGVAIGGVSVGESKKEMRDQVKWVGDYLPKDRPVHLLGVGQIDDIVDLVKYGIDTFDCVEPTRLGRMGSIYQSRFLSHPKLVSGSNLARSRNKFGMTKEEIDITKTVYKNNLEKVDVDCNCYVCKNFTKSYLHHLFKQREILGYTLATYHNLWTMEKLFEKIRELIADDKI